MRERPKTQCQSLIAPDRMAVRAPDFGIGGRNGQAERLDLRPLLDLVWPRCYQDQCETVGYLVKQTRRLIASFLREAIVRKLRPSHDGRAFDRFSSSYERKRRTLGLFEPSVLQRELYRIFPKDRSGLSVFDVGCGNGVFSRLLLDNFGDVTGIDISQKMIDAIPKDITENQRFSALCSDMLVHDFKDDQFDVVFLMDILHHVRRQKELLEVAARLVVPGGRLVLIEYIPSATRSKVVQFIEETFIEEIFLVAPDTIRGWLAGFTVEYREISGFEYLLEARRGQG